MISIPFADGDIETEGREGACPRSSTSEWQSHDCHSGPSDSGWLSSSVQPTSVAKSSLLGVKFCLEVHGKHDH